ncbi:MAG TPA: hypothetical protein DD417_18895, partial [Elusimicrobia bacterium]|nr:hypothetical protein [Elusimicrobiota bacterium]
MEDRTAGAPAAGLEESLSRGRRTAESLNRLLSLALSEAPLDEMLGRCLAELLAIPWLSVQAKGGIFLADRNRRNLRLAAEKGLGTGVVGGCARVPFGRCHCGRAAATGELQYAACVEARHENRYEGMAPHGHYSVPIRLSGEILGVLVLYLNEGHAFDPGEAEFLRAAADVLAGIIRHKKEEKKAAMLAEVALTLSSGEDLRESLRAVLAKVCQSMDWPCGDAWLPASDRESLEFAAAWSAPGPEQEAFALGGPVAAFKPEAGLPGRAFASREAVLSPDVAADPHFPRRELARKAGLRGGLCVPVAAGAGVEAVLCFYSPAADAFDARDLRMAAAVAAQAAPVLQRKLAEERLRLSEESLREAQRFAQIGNWEVHLPTGQVRWSEELYRIFGLPPESQASLGAFLSTVQPVERELVQKQIIDALEQGRSVDLERRALRPDGTLVWVHERAYAEPGPDGRPLRLKGTVQEITERKKLEERLMQAQRMESVGHLAGGVAHDFNNLLTAIQGYAEFVLKDGADAESRTADLREILAACKRATDLTGRLLAFSRKQVLSPRIVDLNALVVNLGRLLKRLLGEKMELRLDLAPGLPSVRVDPGQIEQVLLNLAVNARDAMPEGGKLVIATAVGEPAAGNGDGGGERPSGPCSLLLVSDTGTGMDETVRARLFEPFFTTKGPGKGTGLGLATVYGIVKQSGG